MTLPKLLVTSFATWKPEQPSNASDDLLSAIYPFYSRREQLHWLRHLPVDFQQAPTKVIQAAQTLQPDAIICCGMKEIGSHICIEERALRAEQTRHTSVNVNWLGANLTATEISHDAGQFVCNSLYFDVLKHFQVSRTHYPGQPECPCIFIHIPVLTPFNRDQTIADFVTILARMYRLAALHASTSLPLSA
ncbi:MAG: peptidase C15 [Leptolyngbyaceae bacterium]|nr:peptidase C15 [Leptolyngbyaceae bacterium]